MSEFGSFEVFCRNAPLPVCNFFPSIEPRCTLRGVGIPGHKVGDLGTVLLDIFAIFLAGLGLFFASRREASVGRREIQLVLGAYLFISLCDIFTTGRVFPRIDSYGTHSLLERALLSLISCQIGLIVAFFWMLLLSSIVGYQLMDDGTPVSLILILGSATVLFGGTLYISLDTGFDLSHTFEAAREKNRSIALYILYLGFPLLCAVGYAVSQCILAIRVLGEKKPFIYIMAAVFCFVCGQILEFVASPYICKGTSRVIDGAFFQTLMSLIAMIWVFVTWVSITEDNWSSNVFHNSDYTSSQSTERWTSASDRQRNWKRGYVSESEPKYSRVYGSESVSETKMYRPIHIEKPIGMSVDQGVKELDRYKSRFLDKVENEVWHLIKNSAKRDVTAIKAGETVYRCFPPTSYTDGYVSRLKVMIRYKETSDSETSNLPMYNGEELDSWLTQHITKRIETLYKEFFNSHPEITGKIMLEHLRNHPTAYREVAAQFVESLRESGEPLTEEMCKGLIHFVSEQLSTHSADQLGQQLGNALLHVGGVSVISTFATTLAHSIGSTVAKLAIKLAAKVTFKTALKAGGKMIAKMVITGFASGVASMFAAKGWGTAAAVVLHAITPVIIAAIAAWELSTFTENLADRIAPEVRKVMSGEFEERNRSALDQICGETLDDLAFQLGKTLALDSNLAEQAKEAAKEIAKVKWDALRR